jgi:CRISPR/Cas system-associated protein Cas10 (large subunit of type III CRISPR-Cas system)
LLHDIGRFCQRGGRSGRHEELGIQFCRKYLPDELSEAAELISVLVEPSKLTSILALPGNHSQKALILGDLLSSVGQEERKESEERQEAPGCKMDDPLTSIFSGIELKAEDEEGGPGKPEQRTSAESSAASSEMLSSAASALPLSVKAKARPAARSPTHSAGNKSITDCHLPGPIALGGDAMFPSAELSPDEIVHAYNAGWAEFEKEISRIRGLDPLAYLPTMQYLLFKHTWAIPATSCKSQQDISLYDHSKTACAISSCLAMLDPDKLCTVAERLTSGAGQSEDCFLLVSGDVSGIQKFIYTITSKGAAKGLRGRSFYVQLLCEAASRFILRELSLPMTNLLYSGGGHFYILAPISKEAELLRLRGRIEEALLKGYGGDLYLALSICRLTPEDLKSRRISAKWAEAGAAAGTEKLRRFSELAASSYDRIFGPFPDDEGGTRDICDICKAEIRGSASGGKGSSGGEELAHEGSKSLESHENHENHESLYGHSKAPDAEGIKGADDEDVERDAQAEPDEGDDGEQEERRLCLMCQSFERLGARLGRAEYLVEAWDDSAIAGEPHRNDAGRNKDACDAIFTSKKLGSKLLCSVPEFGVGYFYSPDVKGLRSILKCLRKGQKTIYRLNSADFLTEELIRLAEDHGTALGFKLAANVTPFEERGRSQGSHKNDGSFEQCVIQEAPLHSDDVQGRTAQDRLVPDGITESGITQYGIATDEIISNASGQTAGRRLDQPQRGGSAAGLNQSRKILDFEGLAKASSGIKRIGILRMDVDSLGRIFSEGFGAKASISRISNLSTMLSIFFDGYLNVICSKEQYKNRIYVIYSGGDDLFIVGSWDKIPQLAMDIRRAFRRFTGYNASITISGGIAIEERKYPLYRAAENAHNALLDAKRYERGGKGGLKRRKDALSFLGKILEWDEMEIAEGMMLSLVHVIKPEPQTGKSTKRLPRSILARLDAVSQLYKNGKETLSKQKLSIEETERLAQFERWRWILTYSLKKASEESSTFEQDIKKLECALTKNRWDALESRQRAIVEYLDVPVTWTMGLTMERDE